MATGYVRYTSDIYFPKESNVNQYSYRILQLLSQRIFACLLSLVVIPQALAQIVEPSGDALEVLDQIILQHLEDNSIPGAVVAVVAAGKIVHVKPYGLANVELSVPTTKETVFEIGSISKQFVAAAAMLLVEEGTLDLDKSIHHYLPEVPGEWYGVTMRQLLTHTSGIPDYEEIGSYDIYRFRLTAPEIIKIAQSRPMDFPPGTGWYYSNTGYYLASMILERVEGKPLGEILKIRIFDPIGMTQTRFADPEAIIPNRAAGYWVNKNGDLINRPPTETSSTLGAGGLLSSVVDFALWDAALSGNQLLSEASKSEMWTPVILPNDEAVIGWGEFDYGYGWFLSDYLGQRTQWHWGQVAGFNAAYMRFPDRVMSCVILTHRYEVSLTPNRKAIVHTFIPDLGPIPTE
jgi:D-alanyl-D-alanine carboxypeptidase